MAKRRRKKQVYRLRPSGDGGRAVTDPDGTVSLVGAPSPSGLRITGVLNEPFASLLAEPFDPKRFVRAVAAMDPMQRERLTKLHEKVAAGDHGARGSSDETRGSDTVP